MYYVSMKITEKINSINYFTNIQMNKTGNFQITFNDRFGRSFSFQKIRN